MFLPPDLSKQLHSILNWGCHGDWTVKVLKSWKNYNIENLKVYKNDIWYVALSCGYVKRILKMMPLGQEKVILWVTL